MALLECIAQEVNLDGGRLLFVGGAVRDVFLGRSPKDFDCEVFGVQPARLREILSRHGEVNCVGAAFGVYKLRVDDKEYDFSIPRRDSKQGDGHKGFIIEGDPDMSLTDAARRRDFTINAISYDPLIAEYLDPFDGLKDIENRRLRVVDPERFGDDSLRVLRAVQFAARFDMTMDLNSIGLCRDIDLSDLPAERVWGEFAKLLKAPKPSVGFKLALYLGVVRKLWPELYALVGCEQEYEWHPEGDVWTHTLHVVDLARAELDKNPLSPAEDTTVMLAALCHDLGKPSTTKFLEGRIRALGHEAAGVDPTTTFLARLNVQTIDNYDVKAQVLALVENHLRPFEYFKTEAPARSFRRLSRKVNLPLLARVAYADGNGRPPKPLDSVAIDWFLQQVSTLDLSDGPPKSILMGRHLLALGLTPGPEFGKIIAAVFEKQLDGSVTNEDEAIAAAKELL